MPRGQHDVVPPFFVCGGLVFQPLSFEYLQAPSRDRGKPAERPCFFWVGLNKLLAGRP